MLKQLQDENNTTNDLLKQKEYQLKQEKQIVQEANSTLVELNNENENLRKFKNNSENTKILLEEILQKS